MPPKDICLICANETEEMAWVACDVCLQWFHTQCVGLRPGQAELLHSYHCSKCVPEHGPSVEKRLLKRKRSKIDYVALNEGVVVDKGVHPHVAKFLHFGEDATAYIENVKTTVKNGQKMLKDGSVGKKCVFEEDKLDLAIPGNGTTNSSNDLRFNNGTDGSNCRNFSLKNSQYPAFKPPKDSSALEDQHHSLRNPFIDIIPGTDLTAEYALQTGLPKPVLVVSPEPQELGMQLPCLREDLSVDYIAECVGEDATVEVMDVQSQQGVSPPWNMAQWRDYFYTDEATRDRLRNVISLEVSQVEGLGEDFVRPQMVRDLDLTDLVWDDPEPRPEVTTYCLMSVKGSFTDFHIDFSGTLVYYTVCKGAKTFLMFPPTEHNLSLYTQWSLEEDQNITWFGTYARGGRHPEPPNGGFRVTLAEGDVFIIPSGWIHAVYTPQDSVVVGGNFLTFMDLQMHLRINEIERTTKVPAKFRYPQFNKVLWMASWYVYWRMKKEKKREEGENGITLEKENDQAIFKPKKQFPSAKNIHSTSLEYVKTDPADPFLHPNTSALQPFIVPGLTRTSWDALKAHLAAHYELTRAKPAFRKAIPTHIIGKDVPKYLRQLSFDDISEQS